MVGGDPALFLAGKNATPELVESIRQQLGLHAPLHSQYLHYLKQIVTFDWGHSWYTQEKINQMILQGIGPSLSLTVPGFSLSVGLSLALALFSAWKKNTWMDKTLTLLCLVLLSLSLLVYIIAFQYFFAYRLQLFPINGWDSSWLYRWKYLILPWIIMVVVSIGPNLLIFRSALIEQVMQDYVRTARSKGVSRFDIYSVHILSNALIPIITIVFLQLPYLFTGSLLIEAFFGIPGLGGLLIQSIQNADFPVIKALTVLGALIYVLFNIVVDYLYTLVDPRVRLSQ